MTDTTAHDHAPSHPLRDLEQDGYPMTALVLGARDNPYANTRFVLADIADAEEENPND